MEGFFICGVIYESQVKPLLKALAFSQPMSSNVCECEKQGSASTPPQVAKNDMDDMIEEEKWLQQVDEVYDKLSVQHPMYYDSYNLCDLCQRQKLGSVKVEKLKSICSHLEISFNSRDRKHHLIENLAAMSAECSFGKS